MQSRGVREHLGHGTVYNRSIVYVIERGAIDKNSNNSQPMLGVTCASDCLAWHSLRYRLRARTNIQRRRHLQLAFYAIEKKNTID